MRFSIITPSLRQLELLKRCARSVGDQEVEAEHIIQDGGTGPELENWVRSETRANLMMEPDGGMYDALNRGFARARGEILGWLNCDEQYLPGALRAVEDRFASQPDLDVLLADNLIVDQEGNYLAHRFSLVPTLRQMWVRFPVASCALFFRRRVWRPFDPQWQSAGDWWWFRDMLARGALVGILRQFVAVFTETRANLGLAGVTKTEQAQIAAARPWWARGLFGQALLAVHRWRMFRSGTFSVEPFNYSIYPPYELNAPSPFDPASGALRYHAAVELMRREFTVTRPTGRWIRS